MKDREDPGYPAKRSRPTARRLRQMAAIAAASAALWASGCEREETCPNSGDGEEMRLGGIAPHPDPTPQTGDAGAQPEGQVMDPTTVGGPLSLGVPNPDAPPPPPPPQGDPVPTTPPPVQPPPPVKPPEHVQPVQPPDEHRTAGVPVRPTEPPPRLAGRRAPPRMP
jgi:hypothetical protein